MFKNMLVYEWKKSLYSSSLLVLLMISNKKGIEIGLQEFVVLVMFALLVFPLYSVSKNYISPFLQTNKQYQNDFEDVYNELVELTEGEKDIPVYVQSDTIQFMIFRDGNEEPKCKKKMCLCYAVKSETKDCKPLPADFASCPIEKNKICVTKNIMANKETSGTATVLLSREVGNLAMAFSKQDSAPEKIS